MIMALALALTLTLTKAGAWMADYDIVKRGAALKLENQVS